MKRMVKIGNLPVGLKNNICDVKGVKVGHITLDEHPTHTGITCILPHSGNLFLEKVVAASYVYNGFGKTIGLVQIDELGTIETPILLTNTLSVGKVAEGLVDYMVNQNPNIGVTTGTVNPVVMECNDGSINEIQKRVLDTSLVYEAIKKASSDFIEGDVGAGCGMKCHGFKGGIGSSSRIITIDDEDYTIGVLVNSNFGSSNGSDLIFKGRFMGDLIKDYDLKAEEDKGSIVVVVATDLPLDSRQLKRVCKRCELGIARTGSYAGHGSGDVMIAFSTANRVSHTPQKAIDKVLRFSDNYINRVFKAVVEATEEAVLNSMLHASGKTSFDGTYYKSLIEYVDLFADLLEK